jgi:hypothetical protein
MGRRWSCCSRVGVCARSPEAVAPFRRWASYQAAACRRVVGAAPTPPASTGTSRPARPFQGRDNESSPKCWFPSSRVCLIAQPNVTYGRASAAAAAAAERGTRGARVAHKSGEHSGGVALAGCKPGPRLHAHVALALWRQMQIIDHSPGGGVSEAARRRRTLLSQPDRAGCATRILIDIN